MPIPTRFHGSCCSLSQSSFSSTNFKNGYNVTLRFFEESQRDTCSFRNSSRAISFTTSSIPVIADCFDVDDLFGGNTTQGFVNQTENLGAGQGATGIYWALQNAESYNPQANYSSILYRLYSEVSGGDEKLQPGQYADRVVNVYPSKGCRDKDPSNNPPTAVLPWYGFSCWSEEGGIVVLLRIVYAALTSSQDLRGKISKVNVGNLRNGVLLRVSTRLLVPS